MISRANKAAIAKVAKAMTVSATIMICLLSQRSTKAPMNGDRITWGRITTIVAIARAVADPVSTVMYQINAN